MKGQPASVYEELFPCHARGERRNDFLVIKGNLMHQPHGSLRGSVSRRAQLTEQIALVHGEKVILEGQDSRAKGSKPHPVFGGLGNEISPLSTAPPVDVLEQSCPLVADMLSLQDMAVCLPSGVPARP